MYCDSYLVVQSPIVQQSTCTHTHTHIYIYIYRYVTVSNLHCKDIVILSTLAGLPQKLNLLPWTCASICAFATLAPVVSGGFWAPFLEGGILFPVANKSATGSRIDSNHTKGVQIPPHLLDDVNSVYANIQDVGIGNGVWRTEVLSHLWIITSSERGHRRFTDAPQVPSHVL